MFSNNFESSTVKSIEYDSYNYTLKVIFHQNTEYLYASVPPSVAYKFINAESKGKFIHRIMKAYPYYKIRTPEDYTD